MKRTVSAAGNSSALVCSLFPDVFANEWIGYGIGVNQIDAPPKQLLQFFLQVEARVDILTGKSLMVAHRHFAVESKRVGEWDR